jgi:hypothetical protein
VFIKIRIHMEVFLGDSAYYAYRTRLLIIKKLKAIPMIALDPRGSRGSSPALMKRWNAVGKEEALQMVLQEFPKKWWVDPCLSTVRQRV